MRLLHTFPLWLLLPFSAAANSFTEARPLPFAIPPISLISPISKPPLTEDDKQTFIDTYADLAIREMKRSGIPASITLAQAILESDWGRSRIATEGNNFFCIKCANWSGDTINAPDDEPGLSCFRAYANSYESFLDHTDFLMQGIRYQPLFELNPLDYEAWAYKLKECGYATDEQYGSKLVKTIRDYGLFVYDGSTPMTSFKILDTPVELEEKDELEMQPIEQPILGEPENFNQPENASELVEEEEIMTAPGYRIDGKIHRPGVNFRQPEAPKIEPSTASPMGKIRPILPAPSVILKRK